MVPLSDEDRDIILMELNKLRGSVGSSNMECLTWNSEIEREAQKIARKCSITEEPEKYGIGIVYTSDEVASVSKYVELVAEASSAVSNNSYGCPCVPGNETQCNSYKQFTYWNAGQIGCAVSVCSSPPDVMMKVLTCLFARRLNGGRCAYALGNECEFCSADFGCFDGLCCKSAEPDQKKTCGIKPEQLVPLYRLYHQPNKRMVLTTSASRRTELSNLGYSDLGTLGYISPKMQPQCSHLKPLVELHLPSSDDYAYVVDEYSLRTYLQLGYVNVGVVGYVVDDESLCSSSVTVYGFVASGRSTYYTADLDQAKQIIANIQTLATAVVQLFAAEPPSRDQWTKKHVGVVCLVKDYSAHGYFLRMYDITNGFLLWEQFMFDEFYSTRLCDELIAFEGDNCVYGLNFSSTDEATEFKRALDLKVQALQKRIARKVAQSQVSAASTYGRSTAYTPRFTPVTNMGVVMPSNCGFITKTKPKGRKHKKRITKEEIGEPTNFEHRVHVGWDPETGYAGHAVTDENEPDIQAILRMVNLPTDFKEDKKAVYSVINQFGGVEAVMRDLEHGQRVKATHNAPSPPPLPSRSHGRPREERHLKPMQPVAIQHPVQNNVSRRAEWAPTPPPPPPPPSSSLRMSPPPTYVEATAHVAATTVRAENSNGQSTVSCAPPPPAPPPPPPMVMFQAEESAPTGQASGARADLMAEIRRGKTLKRVDVGSAQPAATKKEIPSERAELMTQIAQGVNLKPVDKAQPKAEPIPAAEELHGIAGALARALLERRSQMTAADAMGIIGYQLKNFLRTGLLSAKVLNGPLFISNSLSRRSLHLQEFNSKRLLKQHGLTVQRFVVIDSVDEMVTRLKDLTADEYVVKAQILAGGRGKGLFANGLKGGVHLTKRLEEVTSLVGRMLDNRLITKQTGPDGVLVNQVMVAESVPIVRETYLAILLDRSFDGPVIMSSPSGGMDIEEVARKYPEKILKIPVDMDAGLKKTDAEHIAKFLGFSEAAYAKAVDQVLLLYDFFAQRDAVLVEVNPFCETEGHDVYVVDAKLQFDDSASFRQKEIFAMHDISGDDPYEREAAENNLNFVTLEGNIGCLVNGAGLAMATMDLIKLHGGDPANFLDVGGSVAEKQVQTAFDLICSNHKVKVILVNVFGGIVNCEIIAKGLVAVIDKLPENVQVVVRLEGTNVSKAMEVLKSSRLPLLLASNMDDGVRLAVQAASTSA
ncbi:hypothetical protein M514_27026, partial [Trichuris suis]